LKNSEGYLPAIHIQNYKELLMVENHNYSKVGNLSLDSAIEVESRTAEPAQNNKFKTVALASALLLLYGVAIVLLMHPISKTG
jgi:hypothetical protein